MATVAQLVEDVAEVMKEPRETVNAYARALIDAGDLPKSRGRAIAHVSASDIAALFTAVCLAPKIKDTAETVERYLSMRVAGVPEGAPTRISFTARNYLSALIDSVQSAKAAEAGSEGKSVLDKTVTFVLTWPEIEIGGLDGVDVRFKEQGTNPSHWEGYHKRVTILSMRAIRLLGIGTGRDYVFDED